MKYFIYKKNRTDYVEFFSDGNAKWGIIKNDGQILFEPVFNEVYPNKNGIAVVITGKGSNAKHGIINFFTGEILVEIKYHFIFMQSNTCAIVYDKQKGLITKGKFFFDTKNLVWEHKMGQNIFYSKSNNIHLQPNADACKVKSFCSQRSN